VHGLTVYGNLRNALNGHDEEVFGFPSLQLNRGRLEVGV
jgi:hypothetical protein